MKLSVIVSTYNQPRWLEKLLWGYHVQTRGNFGLKQVRNRAVAFHLHHPRPYRVHDEMVRNRAIFERIRRNREVRVNRGLDEMAARIAAEQSPGAARSS